ncbi:MAG: Na+-transporting methylmalonyl-CoA/oxaloacetate decarboxylase subunit beta [Bacillota bacterium]
MKIYYNSSLWSKGKGLHGLAQKIYWQFEYAGSKRCIPVIYRFTKGVVFDIITFLDEVKLREFFEKYEAIEETLTPLQRRCAEQEHPYQAVPVKEIWINGRRTESGYSSSSTVSIPWAQQDDGLILVRKAYSSILKDTACFACERFCVPYPKTDSKTQKLLRFLRLDKVNSIKLSTYPVQWFSPLDIHFEMSAKESQKVVCFRHPITGITHTLYFQSAELVEMPLGVDGNRSFYAMHLMYEIEPDLPQGDTLQFNSSIQYTEPSEDRFNPTATSSIGIIGGADGPTAIFVSPAGEEKNVPRGLHGLLLHNCFSIPSFQKDDTSHFVLEGINTKKCDGKEYNF